MQLFAFVGWAKAQQLRSIGFCWTKVQPTLMFILFACFLLLSCTKQMSSRQTVNNPSQCKVVCEQHLESCKKTCRNNCMQCNAYAASNTAKSYCRYVHEQSVRGGLIKRQLNSYHDPLQCAKTTCNCFADYQVCKQSCSGFIHKQLLAPPLSR